MDKIIKCIAFDLLGEYYDLIGTSHLIRIKGGRTLYEHAALTKSENVRLARLSLSGSWVRQINRYISYDEQVELIPKNIMMK